MSAHIPDPHAKTILFYGWYSNRVRDYRKQHVLLWKVRTVDPAPDGDARGSLAMRRSWARLIRKVHEVDPPSCPRCRGTMKVLAVIERPAIVRQILDHLGLSIGTASLPAPPDPPGDQAADQPQEWSYEPFFDDLPTPDPMLG